MNTPRGEGSDYDNATHGWGNIKLTDPSFMCRSGLTFTAIDNFLGNQQNHFPLKQHPHSNIAKNNYASVFDDEFCSFAFSGDSTYKNLFPNTPEASFITHHLLPNEEALNWTHQNPTLCQKDVQVLGNNAKVVERRPKKRSPVSPIKGRWGEEEDRKLLKLVEQYGVRNWSQIAKNLDGRTGKQCSVRWHNHLGPDIKKDGWSEEEEKILVETHAKIGNRWSEMEKLIPGRTENAIKNHWNAAKRRQNPRRKNNRTLTSNGTPQSFILEDYIKSNSHRNATKRSKNITTETSNGKPQSSILEDYIKSKTLNSTTFIDPTKSIITTTTTTPPFSTTTTQSGPVLSQLSDSDVNSLFQQFAEYDDELLFKQQILNQPQQQLVNVESLNGDQLLTKSIITTTTTTPPFSTTTTQSGPVLSQLSDSDVNSLFQQFAEYDDELLFKQQIFNQPQQQLVNVESLNGDQLLTDVTECGFPHSNPDPNSHNMYLDESLTPRKTPTSIYYLDSDLSPSHLLKGNDSSSPWFDYWIQN